LTRSAWLYLVGLAVAQISILLLAASAVWSGFGPEQQQPILAAMDAAGGIVLLAAVAFLAVLGLAIYLVFSRYVQPLRRLAEDARVIALSNPKHRLASQGPSEITTLADAFNQLADRYQTMQEDVERRIHEANLALEEEKNTLAALMSKLTQGVLVCNLDGRILLYNQRAQLLLEGPARATGGGDWIGLGRSVFGVIDPNLISHTISQVRHDIAADETGNVLVPFVVPRPRGQMLSCHFVPILDSEKALRGYILTLDDITRQVGSESRRGSLLQSLTEGQRSAIAGIRAAIETLLSFPDIDESGRQQFLEVIRDEALKMSRDLATLEADYAQELRFRWPLEEMLGSNFLAAVERSIKDSRSIDVAVSAPVEPVWLKVDSYVLICSLGFVIDQLVQSCRAEHLSLKLEQRRSLAALTLEWDGAVLHMEALRTWGLRNVPLGQDGSVNLFEAIERHGGVLWPDRSPSGRPCMRLILPISDAAESPVGSVAEAAHDFDFHLFDAPHLTGNLHDKPLSSLSFTVIDTETTGLDPGGGDEIIAIGAVRIVNRRILHREIFDSFVRPRRAISREAQQIHGITQEMLRAEPPIEDVLPRLQRFVEDTVIVGHNVNFDMRFLEVQGGAIGIAFDNPMLDTLILECEISPHQGDKSLEAIAQRLGIAVTGRHTALGDALTTAEVFLALLPQLEALGIGTLGQAKAACESSRFAQIRY
jgi:DNA polymerase-3 subunit epsilon